MSPSAPFWIDLSIALISGLVAVALLMLVLATGMRRRLDQVFGLFALSATLLSLGSTMTSLSLWLDSPRALFWVEIAAAGFYFVGPSLYAFTVKYVERLPPPDQPDYNRAQPQPFEPNKRWRKHIASLGFAVGLVFLSALFGHHLVENVTLGGGDVYRWELTPLGNVVVVGSFIFEALALALFWQYRKRLDGPALTIGAAGMALGGLMGGPVNALAHIPFPIARVVFAVSILLVGYAVTSRQIFNPLQRRAGQLEQEVAQRTQELTRTKNRLRRLTEHQRVAAEISREIAGETLPTEMLARLVDQIHNRLGFHHVYVYQPDEPGQGFSASRYLTVQAASGTTARTVLASAHRVRIDEDTLIGQVGLERHPRVAENHDLDTALFADTALPGAQSEIAVPLLAGDRLLGVLDVQSIHPGAFSDLDLTVLTMLADQVAVTLENARLLQETHRALDKLEEVQRRFLGKEWQSLVGEGAGAPAFIYTDKEGVAPATLQHVRSREIAQAVSGGQAITDAAGSVVALPILLRGQTIGALQLSRKADQTWQAKDVDLLKEVAERLGLALEAARLSEEAQRNAARQQLIGRVASRTRETLDLETVLKTAAQEVREALGLPEVVIRLGPRSESTPTNGKGSNRGEEVN